MVSLCRHANRSQLNSTRAVQRSYERTVAHEGDGVPAFQMYAGLNLQFPL